MARPLREFHKGGFWHFVNRGMMKEEIFRQRDDYFRCLYKLKESLKKYPVNIHSFNFIPNHLHYLIEQASEKILPSQFLASFHTAIAAFINRKYGRVGHLFQDRCKVIPIKDNEHLLNISFYVNLNKVLEKMQRLDRSVIVSNKILDELLLEAERDPWSSYGVYCGSKKDDITKSDFILSLLSSDMKKAQQEYKKLARAFLISGHFLKTRDLIFEDNE